MFESKCPFCGKVYNNPDAWLNCANQCRKKQRDEEQRVQEQKVAKEKESRRQEVEDVLNKLFDLTSQFHADYREYPTANSNYRSISFIPSWF